MYKYFILITTAFLSLGGLVEASSISDYTQQLVLLQTTLENTKLSGAAKELVLSNIAQLEQSIVKKISKYQDNLNALKENLNNSQNGTEVQKWLKKIESLEKKISELKDILLSIDLLKAKLER